MAGGSGGVAPKYPEERRNAAVPSAGEWTTLPAEPYVGPRPADPEFKTEAARWTWDLWWKSPMAHMWEEADWPVLVRMIGLIDGDHVSLDRLREARILEEKFGLSPRGRQNLRWRLAKQPPPDTKPKKGHARGKWADLHLVEGDAVPT